MRFSGIVATSHQFRQYTTELHNVLPQNVLLGTTYFLAIREIPRNKLTWAETSQDGFHWWYLKGHGETGQTCIHLGSPRWASEKCFRPYLCKDMNFAWNPLINIIIIITIIIIIVIVIVIIIIITITIIIIIVIVIIIIIVIIVIIVVIRLPKRSVVYDLLMFLMFIWWSYGPWYHVRNNSHPWESNLDGN